MCIKSLGLLALTLGLSLVLNLSEGGAIPGYTQFGAGARPAGLGGAFSAIADDANSAIWNSANMVLAHGPELTGTHTSSYMGSSFDCLAGVIPIEVLGRRSCLGLYFLRAATGEIPIVEPLSDTVPEVKSGTYGTFETIWAAFGLGVRLSELFLLGGSASLVRTRLLQSSASGRGFNLAISVDAKRKETLLGRTTVSLQMRNISARSFWSSGHSELESPHLLLAIAYRPWTGDRLIVSTDIERSPWNSNPHSDWRCGLEFTMVPVLPLRFGYDGESVAAGVGCRGKHIRLDYALSFHKELAESHCVSLTLSK